MTIESIRQRVAAATPGPWTADDDPELTCDSVWANDGDMVASTYGSVAKGSTDAADATFIAHARTDVELLLAVAEAAKAVKAQCDDMCPRWYDEPCDCGMAALADALAALEAGA